MHFLSLLLIIQNVAEGPRKVKPYSEGLLLGSGKVEVKSKYLKRTTTHRHPTNSDKSEVE